MKSINQVNAVGLIDLEARRHWLAAATAQVDDYEVLSAQQVLVCLQGLGVISPDQTICIATAARDRLSAVVALFKVLHRAGLSVLIWTLTEFSDELSGLPATSIVFAPPKHCELLIDCIASLDQTTPTTMVQAMIVDANRLAPYTVALECPSGINPNTGACATKAVSAQLTLGLQTYLQGVWTGTARAYTGKLLILHLLDDLPVDSMANLLTANAIQQICPRREAYTHKHDFSTVVVVAGEASMFGAALLAAQAALVMGAGLVKLLYPAELTAAYSQYPELIWIPITDPQNFDHAIGDRDIVVFGPGLGMGAWADSVWTKLKHYPNTMVVDASALQALASDPQLKPNWIITPHPGEAATLLACTSVEVQSNRFAAIAQLQQKYQATVVLKGSGTMIMGPTGKIEICGLGHAGMATPGMGDILSGLIAGACAQGLQSENAAKFAVWLHAFAATKLGLESMNGIVLASAVLAQIQRGGKVDACYML